MFVDARRQLDTLFVLARPRRRGDGEVSSVALDPDGILLDAGKVRDDAEFLVGLVDGDVGVAAEAGVAGLETARHPFHHPLDLAEDVVEWVVAVVASHARRYE